jgi:hypothetical protein
MQETNTVNMCLYIYCTTWRQVNTFKSFENCLKPLRTTKTEFSSHHHGPLTFWNLAAQHERAVTEI